LYDLRRDPGELKNLYQPNDPTAEKLRKMLAGLRPKAPGGAPAAAGDASNDLQSLGYAGTASGEGKKTSNLPDPKDKIEEQNLLHIAMLASEDNRPADARAALEKVLALDPRSPTALLQLGELEFQEGDFSKAAEHLGRARAVRPDDATAAWYQGQALQKLGDLPGARDALETSLKLTPSQPAARVLLGNVYLALKQPQAADDQFEAALLVDSQNVGAQLGLAKVALAENHPDDALKQLEPLSQSQSQNPQVFEVLSEAYSAAGKKDEAQAAAKRAGELRENGNAK
jgi:predicted Zn-dependent protease